MTRDWPFKKNYFWPSNWAAIAVVLLVGALVYDVVLFVQNWS